MMRLTRKSDVCLNILKYFYDAGAGQWRSSYDVANALNEPYAFVQKGLHTLNKHGYIKSWKGPKGGFTINLVKLNNSLYDFFRDVNVLNSEISLNQNTFAFKLTASLYSESASKKLGTLLETL